MRRIPVVSSNLSSIGYNAEKQILEIEFNNGGIYHYFNVPSSLYDRLMSANSHGKFFHQYIRGRYSDKKI